MLILNEDTIVEPGTDRPPGRRARRPIPPPAPSPRASCSPTAAASPRPGASPSPLGCAVAALTLGQAGVDQSAGARPAARGLGDGLRAARAPRGPRARVGAFDEGFFMYVEETDLCRRLADGGWDVRLVPDVRVQHHLKQSTSGAFERRVREIWRSRRRYWAKHHSPLGARAARLLLAAQYAGLTLAARLAPGRVGVPAAELRLHLRLRPAARSRARACASRRPTGTRSMPLSRRLSARRSSARPPGRPPAGVVLDVMFTNGLSAVRALVALGRAGDRGRPPPRRPRPARARRVPVLAPDPLADEAGYLEVLAEVAPARRAAQRRLPDAGRRPRARGPRGGAAARAGAAGLGLGRHRPAAGQARPDRGRPARRRAGAADVVRRTTARPPSRRPPRCATRPS